MKGATRRAWLWLRRALPPSPIEIMLRSRLTLDVHGADELPDRTGPTMIVANFASPADPALVLTALPEPVAARYDGDPAGGHPALVATDPADRAAPGEPPYDPPQHGR